MGSDENLVPFFMPALGAILLHKEDEKGTPLTEDEVLEIRDSSPCIMMKPEDAGQMHASRGYVDIDPENCWYDFQMLRRELGRKPDVDPGPRIWQVREADPEYQQAVQQAQATLDEFQQLLVAGETLAAVPMVKMRIVDGEHSACMWLCQVRAHDDGFAATVFEIPEYLPSYSVGDDVHVPAAEVLDWMVNDGGRLHGGFSLRYQRQQLPESERAEFDEYIGVTEYL